MDFKFVRGLFFVFLVGGVSLFIFFMRPSEDRPVLEQGGAWRKAEEDVHLDGIHFREWKKGELQWDLNARVAKYYHNEEKAFFQDVSLVFYPPEGAPMNLHADRVFYEMAKRELKAEGNVWGEGDQGFRFYTGSILYDLEAKEAETEDQVVLKKDRLTIKGIGMKGSLTDQTFVLLSSVRTVFVPGEALP